MLAWIDLTISLPLYASFWILMLESSLWKRSWPIHNSCCAVEVIQRFHEVFFYLLEEYIFVRLPRVVYTLFTGLSIFLFLFVFQETAGERILTIRTVEQAVDARLV